MQSKKTQPNSQGLLRSYRAKKPPEGSFDVSW
jgi:hypothetical protein